VIDRARSFDRAAEAYESARPSYPDALLDHLPLGPDAGVLDLGAGTGKLTRVLVGRYARVVAVEPLDGMRAILERVVPDAESLAGSAEAIPLRDASVDGVFAVTAFHWFANDDAVAEIGRVLRPGGVFAWIWNDTIEPQPLPEPYAARFREVEHEAGGEPRTDGELKAAMQGGPFGELQTGTVLHEQVQDRVGVLAYASSTSAVARRADAAAVLAELGDLLPEGAYRFAMRANVTWAVRA
jgi:SAM-dependent methyltransferase